MVSSEVYRLDELVSFTEKDFFSLIIKCSCSVSRSVYYKRVAEVVRTACVGRRQRECGASLLVGVDVVDFCRMQICRVYVRITRTHIAGAGSVYYVLKHVVGRISGGTFRFDAQRV